VRLLIAGQEADATAEVLDSRLVPQEALSALRAYRRRFPRVVPARGDGVVMVRLRRPHAPHRQPETGAPANRRIVVTRYGGPEVMRLTEEAVPEPDFGEVRLKVTAVDVNFTDILLREGVYPGGPRPPFTPGYDLVGVIDAVGPGAGDWEPGRSVAALTVHGAYADYVCVPARHVVPVPPGVDPVQAVALVLSYVTAYQLLHRVAHVHQGERVLVQGAAGAVGTAALQLGPREGGEMYGTAAGDAVPGVAARGATAIDYTTGNVADRVREASGGGVDVALDGVGGRTAWGSYRALRPGGRLVLFGHYAALSRGRRALPRTIGFYLAGALLFAATVLPGRRKVTMYRIAELRDRRPDWFRDDLTMLFGLLAQGEISPVIAETLPLTQAARAHERLAAGDLTGKQVLLCHPSATAGGPG
jgi:NADPH2:quinone reductase